MGWRAAAVGWLLALTAAPSAFAGDPTAEAAMLRAGCNLCHADAPVAPAARVDSCSGCHAWIRQVSAVPAAREAAVRAFPNWARYERNLHTYFEVPSLTAAAARLEPGWVDGYLAHPFDLRPAMPEGMPRFALTEAERASIRAWFADHLVAVPDTPPVSAARAEAGRVLFETRGCVACHTFGATTPGPGIPSAPDLAHARERLDPDRAVAWIRDPKSLAAGATMPALGLTLDEAVAVRDYLWTADPKAVPATPAGVARFAAPVDAGPPPATPRWADVESRVFGRICTHCHMDPAQNDGRAGPGNAGGFGWPATGIELQTRAGVVANGDAVLAAMRRRVDEATRESLLPGVAPAAAVAHDKPGMPLGLPPLSEADIAMVERWLAAGGPE